MTSKFNLAASVQPSEMTAELLRIIAADEVLTGEPFVEYDDMGNKCVSFYVQRGDVKITDAEYRKNTIEMFRMVDAEIGGVL